MNESRARRWTDERIDTILGNLLRAGVILSAVVVLFGGALYLSASGGRKADDKVFHGEPARLRTIPGVVDDAAAGEPLGIIQLGILLLLATPIARVAFSVFAFAMQKDVVYVLVTLFVLITLLYSVCATP